MSAYDPKAKAIETAYAGYRMRSRLEAKWAAFFDAERIKWDYECEGFELPSGRYLPDFWLPEWNSFVEVKPFPLVGRDLARAIDLVKLSKRHLIQCDGTPDTTNYWMLEYREDEPPRWMDFVWSWKNGSPYFCTHGMSLGHTVRVQYSKLGDFGGDEPQYKESVKIARSMRFGD